MYSAVRLRFQPSLTAIDSMACFPSKYFTHLSHASCDSSPWLSRTYLDVMDREREVVDDVGPGVDSRVADGLSCADIEIVVSTLDVGDEATMRGTS